MIFRCEIVIQPPENQLVEFNRFRLYPKVPMDQYWVYIDKEIKGPFAVKDALALPGFSPSHLVCQSGDDSWQPAREIADFGFVPASVPRDGRGRPPVTPYSPAPTRHILDSGDVVSPNFQMDRPRRGRSSKRHNSRGAGSTFRPVRHVPLPQPPEGFSLRRFGLITLFLVSAGSVWVYGLHHGFSRVLVAKWLALIHTFHYSALPVAPALRSAGPPLSPVHRPAAPKPLPLPGTTSQAAHSAHSRKPWLQIHRKGGTSRK